MKKELVKEAFDYGYTSYHECNTDLDYEQHLEDCYVSILDSEYENNNGWIKILSEEDLPKELYIKADVIKNNKTYIHCDYRGDNIWWNYEHKILIENATHYQPIKKPLKPIY